MCRLNHKNRGGPEYMFTRGNVFKRKPYFVGFVLMGATVLAACGSSSAASSSSTATSGSANASTKSTSSKTPYVIHALVSETGTFSSLGGPEAKALTALAKYVNATGGIDGHPVQMSIQDNQSSPSTNVSLATPLIQKGVPILINGSGTATGAAVDALATPKGPFIFDLSPGNHPKPGSMVFTAGTPTSYDLQVILTYLKAKGVTRIAALTSSDATGTDGWNQLKAGLAQPGFSSVKVLAHETFNPSSVSVATQLSVIKSKNPQAIIVWTVGAPFGTVLQGVSSLGMGNIPIFTSNGNANYGLLTHLSSYLPKSLNFIGEELYMPPADIKNPTVKSDVEAFDTAMKKAGGVVEAGYGLGWDPAYLLVKALRKLGVNATAPQILNYMQNLHNSSGIYGVYNFSQSNHDGIQKPYMHIFVFKGTYFEPVSHGGGLPLSAS